MSTLNPGGEHRTVLMGDDEPVLKIKLPRGVGYVEIRTTGVNGPTGYPVVSVDVVSETEHSDAADGRRYSPTFDHRSAVVLIGRPGPKLAEQEGLLAYVEKAFEAHNNGNHDHCPPSCPVVQAHQGH